MTASSHDAAVKDKGVKWRRCMYVYRAWTAALLHQGLGGGHEEVYTLLTGERELKQVWEQCVDVGEEH